jgi:uncharacterized protein (TIGR02246 family)
MKRAPQIAHDPPSDDAEAALRALVGDIEQGFNSNDPELSTAHFAQNATAVAVNGTRIDGREDLLEANRVGLTGFLRDETAHYKLTDIRFLGPDAAIAHKLAWSTSDAAADGQTPEMIALYVFAHRDGRWWIVARQNTAITT